MADTAGEAVAAALRAGDDAAGFVPFGVTHAWVIAAHGGAALLLVLLGWVWRGREAGERLHTVWTWFVIVVQAVNLIFWSTPPRLDLGSSLPLHICDVAGLVAGIALVTEARWARIIMVYWGLGLSTQAFITPIIRDAPDTMRFQLFFLSHLTIVATPLYDIIARGLRLRWFDFVCIVGFTLVYGGVVVPLNMLFSWNYGYVGRGVPGAETVIDQLGPWPVRLLWLGLIVFSGFAVMTLMCLDRRTDRRGARHRADGGR